MCGWSSKKTMCVKYGVGFKVGKYYKIVYVKNQGNVFRYM